MRVKSDRCGKSGNEPRTPRANSSGSLIRLTIPVTSGNPFFFPRKVGMIILTCQTGAILVRVEEPHKLLQNLTTHCQPVR